MYDLYKREKKFETNLEKINNKEFETPTELNWIIAGISFIFNVSKNKEQYQQDSFKKMQYALWQVVIEVGRTYYHYDISAYFLQHSLEKEPNDLFITKGNIVEKIKNDAKFKEILNNIIKEYGRDSEAFIFDSSLDDNFPISFDDGDLYFSIHYASLKIIGKKQNEKWNLNINLHDRYDYTEVKWPDKYYNDTNNIPKSILSSTLYNCAHLSEKFNVMKEYNIDIQFEMNGDEVMQI